MPRPIQKRLLPYNYVYFLFSGDDAECGTSGVRDVLVIVCCVLSLLVVLEWSVCTALWRCAVMDSGIEKQDRYNSYNDEYEYGVSCKRLVVNNVLFCRKHVLNKLANAYTCIHKT